MSDIDVIEIRGDEATLTYDDVISILEANRSRLRTLSNLILTVDGFLFSISFLAMFFILETGSVAQSVIWLMIAGILALLVSMTAGILSALIPLPTVSRNRADLVNHYAVLFQRESRLVRLSIMTMFGAMLLFVIAIVVLVILIA